MSKFLFCLWSEILEVKKSFYLLEKINHLTHDLKEKCTFEMFIICQIIISEIVKSNITFLVFFENEGS